MADTRSSLRSPEAEQGAAAKVQTIALNQFSRAGLLRGQLLVPASRMAGEPGRSHTPGWGSEIWSREDLTS